jgi:hypothetical protein
MYFNFNFKTSILVHSLHHLLVHDENKSKHNKRVVNLQHCGF